MSFDKIPRELTELPQWIVWKDKRPYQCRPNKYKAAKASQPDTWSTYSDACQRFTEGGFGGIGFEFHTTDDYCGIDLDGCRDPKTGNVEDWARAWIIKFDSYTEVSPSLTGVKIFVRGHHILGDCTGRKEDMHTAQREGIDKQQGVEIYDHGRYFATTGIRLAVKLTCEPRQSVIDEFCNLYFPKVEYIPRIPNESSVVERAAKYAATMPPSISGSSGHSAAFRVACVLTLGFGLDEDEATQVFSEWNQTCQPPWNEREITHKVKSASKQPGARNYLRDARQEDWSRIAIPKYVPPVQPKYDLITTETAARKYMERLIEGRQSLFDLGIADVDAAVGGGVAPGEMVIIAARPSHGKSAVALQILDTAARQGRKGIIISEEMSSLALGKRTIQFAVDRHEEYWRQESAEVIEELDEHFATRENVYIAEYCRSVEVAVATIKKTVEETGAEIAVVDYAQLLRSDGKTQFDQVTNTSIALRQCASELGIVLIVLCQMSREIEKRDKFVPRMSDLRNSGQLEQDADVVIFIVWPHRINDSKSPKDFQFFVMKNRNRPINSVVIDCHFEPSRQRVMHIPPPKVEEMSNFDQTLAQYNKGSGF